MKGTGTKKDSGAGHLAATSKRPPQKRTQPRPDRIAAVFLSVPDRGGPGQSSAAGEPLARGLAAADHIQNPSPAGHAASAGTTGLTNFIHTLSSQQSHAVPDGGLGDLEAVAHDRVVRSQFVGHGGAGWQRRGDLTHLRLNLNNMSLSTGIRSRQPSISEMSREH